MRYIIHNQGQHSVPVHFPSPPLSRALTFLSIRSLYNASFSVSPANALGSVHQCTITRYDAPVYSILCRMPPFLFSRSLSNIWKTPIRLQPKHEYHYSPTSAPSRATMQTPSDVPTEPQHRASKRTSVGRVVDPTTLYMGFDRTCLAQLDEQLLLRPVEAFGDMFWSTLNSEPRRTERWRDRNATPTPQYPETHIPFHSDESDSETTSEESYEAEMFETLYTPGDPRYDYGDSGPEIYQVCTKTVNLLNADMNVSVYR